MTDDPREVLSAEDWLQRQIAEGDGPVEAMPVPRESRLLLLAGKRGIRRRDVIRARWLSRWTAQQHRVRVHDGRVSVGSGFIGVTAFTKRGVLRKAARS